MAVAKPTSLAQALLAFQAEGVKLQKNAINPHFKNKYISLDSLMESVLPVLNASGLVLLQLPTAIDGAPALTTRIVHADSGESVEATMLLQLQKSDPQSQGSAITYARRYAAMSFLGLVADEDTDGRAAARARGGAAEGAANGPAAPTPSPANGDTKYASEAQRKRLFAIKNASDVPDAELRRILGEVTGQESTAQIPADKYDAVIAAIEALKPVPFE